MSCVDSLVYMAALYICFAFIDYKYMKRPGHVVSLRGLQIFKLARPRKLDKIQNYKIHTQLN